MRILLAIAVFTILGGALFEVTGAGLGFLVGLMTGLIWHARAHEQKQANKQASQPQSATRARRPRISCLPGNA